MPAVVPLAVAGVSALAQYYAAKKAAGASEHAADTQSQSSQQELDFLKQHLAQNQSLLAPYQQAGADALGPLRALLGLGISGSYAGPGGGQGSSGG